VARATNTFGPTPAVTCEATAADLIGPHDETAAQETNPCRGYDCGLGTCVPINDVPTCRCMPGYVAVVVGTAPDARPQESPIRCVSPTHLAGDAGVVVPAPPDASRADAPADAVAPASEGGCACRTGPDGSPGPWSLSVLALAWWVRSRALSRRPRQQRRV
jgi:MYXO-CTERM domain-containing protein